MSDSPATSRLSRSEWEFLLICWRLGRPTGQEVIRVANQRRVRDSNTIYTYLTRIVGKGFLKIERENHLNHYVPIVDPPTALREECMIFFEEVLGSDPEYYPILRKALDEAEARAAKGEAAPAPAPAPAPKPARRRKKKAATPRARKAAAAADASAEPGEEEWKTW